MPLINVLFLLVLAAVGGAGYLIHRRFEEAATSRYRVRTGRLVGYAPKPVGRYTVKAYEDSMTWRRVG